MLRRAAAAVTTVFASSAAPCRVSAAPEKVLHSTRSRPSLLTAELGPSKLHTQVTMPSS